MSDRIDLMVLVADLDMEQAVRGLFSRPQPLRNAQFFRLGQQVDARGCTDPAFGELRGTLQTWFPEVNDGEG